MMTANSPDDETPDQPDAPCPWPDRFALIERFERLYTGAIMDILQVRGLHQQWLGPQLKCLTHSLERRTIAGCAFTVQWIYDPRPDERKHRAAGMIESFPAGAIVIVDTGADQESGFWGELATTRCLQKQVRGAVVNGGIKDLGHLRRMELPIFARFSTPVDGFYRSRLRAWQIPVWINDVLIRPWDVLVADCDGVLCVPAEIAAAVCSDAEARCAGEAQTRYLLQSGVSAPEATERTQRTDL